MQRFIQLLKSSTVNSVPRSKAVVVINSTETPVQGFEKLLQNNILSAPVFDEATKKFVGFLDVRDLVSFTVFCSENRNTIAYEKPGDPFYKTVVEHVTVTYLARRNPYHPVLDTATLFEAAQVLAAGVHRVPIVDAQGTLVSIFSQSNLISFFNQHLEEGLKDEAFLRLTDIDLGSSPVITVQRDELTIEVLKKMDKAKVSGVPIADADGKLIGNISGKDLKLFVESAFSFEVLNLPILQFLTQLRLDDSIDIRAPTISCRIDETLGMVIRKLAATHIHRLYIVNSSVDYTPVRVISLTDVLRHILQGTTPRRFSF